MRCKCIKCKKQTKNIPFNVDKKAAKGWYWTNNGLVCESCYNKSLESLVSKNGYTSSKDSYNGVRSKER